LAIRRDSVRIFVRDIRIEILDLDLRRGCQGRDMDRRVHPDIRASPTVKDLSAQMRDGIVIGQVDRRQRRVPACGLNAVVQFLQPADGARDSDHVGPFEASHSAQAAPSPREAPVTSAT
jgi:hypothetical protein